MPTVALTDAQATGLLALLEHAEHNIMAHAHLDGRRRGAMQRGITRLRDAIGGRAPTLDAIDHQLDALGALMAELRDPDVIRRCRAGIDALVGAVRIAAGVERLRLAAAQCGDETYARWASGVLERYAAGDPRWREAAITLFDDLCLGPAEGDEVPPLLSHTGMQARRARRQRRRLPPAARGPRSADSEE